VGIFSWRLAWRLAQLRIIGGLLLHDLAGALMVARVHRPTGAAGRPGGCQYQADCAPAGGQDLARLAERSEGDRMVTGGGRGGVEVEEHWPVNSILANLKTAMTGAPRNQVRQVRVSIPCRSAAPLQPAIRLAHHAATPGTHRGGHSGDQRGAGSGLLMLVANQVATGPRGEVAPQRRPCSQACSR